jgi:sugar/nucleoside kinase (ribokinase family)
MKLLAVGHTVIDHLTKNGVESIAPGGLFYTAAGLLNIRTDDDEIYLCTAIEKSSNLFSLYDSSNKLYIHYADKIPKVHLIIHEDEEREEIYENISDELKLDLKNLNIFDGILVNMITGYDLSAGQMEMIRNNFDGEIYFDVHTLSRGLSDEMNREFRPVPNIERWLDSVDILQANENEMLTLSKEKNERKIAEYILGFSVKIFIVTKAERGARIYYKKNGEIISEFVSAVKIKVKNKIGCGDVFGAVFFYNYMKTKELFNSLKLANAAAGLTASYENLDQFKYLGKDVFTRYN